MSEAIKVSRNNLPMSMLMMCQGMRDRITVEPEKLMIYQSVTLPDQRVVQLSLSFG